VEDVDFFAERVREHYAPDGGLSAVFAIGGTRTTYILLKGRHQADPGHIEDFGEYSNYLQGLYRNLIKIFFDLGGQHLIVTAFSFRGFKNRGEKYSQAMTDEMYKLINEPFQEFYEQNSIIPSFVGIDTLITSDYEPLSMLGQTLDQFQRNWPVKEGGRHLIWEMASMPLYSFWNICNQLSAKERAELQSIDSVSNFDTRHTLLYKFFARRIYGCDVPMPHFYLGTNRSGDLKWRSPMPITLTGGDGLTKPVRMFYTPYPTLMLQPETLYAIINDITFGKRFASSQKDYSGQYTTELAQKEYERFHNLSLDPETTIGLSRAVSDD
jgi:hypothetical protein